ncbi:NUDIX hydrolase [Gephyromycinifex aptenodytis]|uniref:NUDIX hydrolase n=1 Tax=Gephyromycinifex aptenodytis TaxID=2716227 RepID=UPI001447B08F|nr:NUDIX domain-containing protein [Gephyromycinifex aptenodytis]
MPIPEFVARLREHVGHDPLWLPGMSAVILKDDPQRPGGPPWVLLVRRSDDGSYTPVTGIVDPAEHPARTAVREAAEEACVQIRVERLVAVRVVGPVTYPNGDVSNYLDHAFRCRWVSGDPVVGDDESTEAGWWPTDGLPPMLARHEEAIRLALAEDSDVFFG